MFFIIFLLFRGLKNKQCHQKLLLPRKITTVNLWTLMPYRCQFHQRFTSAFFVRKCVFGAKISYKSCILGLKFLAPKFRTKILCKKRWWNWPQHDEDDSTGGKSDTKLSNVTVLDFVAENLMVHKTLKLKSLLSIGIVISR